ncbi:MAG: QueT transporter family protein, partial [Clostridia bacterium]|nr:QueT transporter family protein [Clostridia bacterium]
MKNNVKFLARAGMIAALYIALTAVSAVLGLASGAVQVRISEALCVLPVFTAAAIPGVTVGCLLS